MRVPSDRIACTDLISLFATSTRAADEIASTWLCCCCLFGACPEVPYDWPVTMVLMVRAIASVVVAVSMPTLRCITECRMSDARPSPSTTVSTRLTTPNETRRGAS